MAKVKEVPLEKLTIDQLDYVGKQIEQDISNYSQYYSSLRIANNKFLDNKDYIKDLRNYQDREILVPMTSSLYIPGKCSDVKKLTIEIGGNFYVETTIDKADKFCDRKLESIKKNMDKIDEMIKNKNEQLNAVNQQLIEKQLKAEPKK
jgi:prefoldin alpha subunit